jgi:molecular chaperone GrpE
MADGNSGNRNMPDQQGAQPGDAGDATQRAGVMGMANGGQSLEEQLAAARAEAEQYKDKYLREYAEKDNFRKRQERMAADRVRREKLDVLERVLDITDNLERALSFQGTMDRASLEQGLRLLGGQLNELVRAEGLTPIPTVGEPFNPYVHEAVESVPSTQYPEGVVAEEVRKGYKQGDETVRPARVKVSSGPPRK